MQCSKVWFSRNFLHDIAIVLWTLWEPMNCVAKKELSLFYYWSLRQNKNCKNVPKNNFKLLPNKPTTAVLSSWRFSVQQGKWWSCHPREEQPSWQACCSNYYFILWRITQTYSECKDSWETFVRQSTLWGQIITNQRHSVLPIVTLTCILAPTWESEEVGS